MTDTDPAMKRALKLLKSEGYAKMPKEDLLKTAKEYEQVKSSRIQMHGQFVWQVGSLAVNALSSQNGIRDEEKNRPVADKAREFLLSAFEHGLTLSNTAMEELKDATDPFNENSEASEDADDNPFPELTSVA